MVILDNVQGSLDWLASRLWRLTASEMKANITSTGKLSKSEAAMKSIDKLIAGIDLADELNLVKNKQRVDDMNDWELKEFMSHFTGDKFKDSSHTRRGNDLEPDALAALSERIGKQVHDVGMCIMGNDVNGVVSCSPDGYTSDGPGRFDEGVEVKSPSLCTYYKMVVKDELPSEYRLQVNASMAICEVDVWHFGAYFKDKPLFYKRVERSDFTDTVQASLNEFKELYGERFDAVQESVARLEVAGKELI